MRVSPTEGGCPPRIFAKHLSIIISEAAQIPKPIFRRRGCHCPLATFRQVRGKSVLMARHVDIKHAIEVWRYMAGWPTKLEGRTLPLSGTLVPGQQYAAFSTREPVGVGGAIAGNFPLLMVTWK